MEIFLVVWAVAVFAMFLLGLHDVVNMSESVQWLKRTEKYFTYSEEHEPFFIILLPVLREQRLIRETLRAFANLNYPFKQMRVVVITAEKELVQREEAKERLLSLSKDIASKRFPPSLLVEKYLGI